MTDVLRQSVAARTARAAGKAATLLSHTLHGQHSYGNLSTTDNLQIQFAGWGFLLVGFYLGAGGVSGLRDEQRFFGFVCTFLSHAMIILSR